MADVGKMDIELVGSANMQETDAGTPQGGAMDDTVGLMVRDLDSSADTVKICSDSASDTTQTVTLTGRIAANDKIEDSATLNGTTPVALTGATSYAIVLKAIKSATSVGHVAWYYNTATHSGAAVSGGTDFIELDAGASGTERAYTSMVIKITSGSASGDIRRVHFYDHAAKKVTPHAPFSAAVAGSDTFEIYRGGVFRNETGTNETEQLKLVRINYDAESNDVGGGAKDVFEEGYVKNCNAGGDSSTATNVKISELVDPSGRFTFGLAGSLGDTGTFTNRLTAPGGITFNGDEKTIPSSGNLAAGAKCAVYFKQSIPEGAAKINSNLVMQVQFSA